MSDTKYLDDIGDRGLAVKALDFEPKGPEFEPSSDHWDFSEQKIHPTLLHSTKV